MLTDMDYVRAAIINAIAEGHDIFDLYEASQFAQTAADFDDAMNELIFATGKAEADFRDQFRDLFPK